MIVRRHKAGQVAIASAVVGFVALGLGIPIFVTETNRIALQGSSLVAAPRDWHQITEPLTISGLPGVVVERGSISLSDKHFEKPLTGEAAAALIASGTARLVLEGATLVVDPAAPDKALDAAADVAPLAAALAGLGFESLSIRRATLARRIDATRHEAIGEVVGEIVNRRKSSIQARGTVTIRGQKLGLDVALGLVQDKRTQGLRPQTMRLAVKGAPLEASIEASASPTEPGLFAGQGDIAVRNVREMARWIGLGWPAGPGLADLRVKGPVTWDGKTLAFQKATMQMDGNEANGPLSIRVVDGRPSVSGTLALQTLDISRYVKDWRRESARSIIDDVMGPGPLDLPLLRLVDADLRLSAQRVRTGSVEFGQCAATLSIKNGKMLADIAEVAIDDASGTGQLIVDANGPVPRFIVRGKLTGFEVSRIVPDTPGAISLRGKGDVIADIAAAGDTVTDVLRTLTGKVSISMPAGAKVGLDLRSLMTAAQKQPFTGWSSSPRGTTTVENLQSRLVVSEGVVFTESFSALLGDSRLTATGGGSLRNGVVDLRLSMVAQPPAGGRAAAAGAQTAVDALVLRGPWHEPFIRADRVLRNTEVGTSADAPAAAPEK